MTLLAPDSKLLFKGPDWDFDLIPRVHDACGEIAINETGLDPYPNQIEVITTEQMLDVYASTGMAAQGQVTLGLIVDQLGVFLVRIVLA